MKSKRPDATGTNLLSAKLVAAKLVAKIHQEMNLPRETQSVRETAEGVTAAAKKRHQRMR